MLGASMQRRAEKFDRARVDDVPGAVGRTPRPWRSVLSVLLIGPLVATVAAVYGATTAGADPLPPYAVEVLADSPAAYYRFAEPGGAAAAADSSTSAYNLTSVVRNAFGEPGAMATGTDPSVMFQNYT